MSFIKQMRREKLPQSGNNRETRWDLIRKKHCNGGGSFASSLKSDAVRRFIEIDFIGKKQKKLLNGEPDAAFQLNPQLVMDMRHKLFQRNPKRLPLATVAHQQKLDKCVAHNMEAEQRYISNELNRFRAQLEKQHKRNKIKMRNVAAESETALPFLESNDLMRSLTVTAKHIEDFYTAPIEALEANNVICNETLIVSINEGNCDNKENVMETHEEKFENFQQQLQTNDIYVEQAEHISTSSAGTSPRKYTQQLELRCVRFEPAVEVLKYQRESSSCSSSSVGIDSVISDLAEEALMELQMEKEQQERNEQELANATEMATEVLTEAVMPPDTQPFLTITQLKAPELPYITKTYGESADSDETETSIASTASNHEQNLIIEQLFQSRAHTNVVILRRYFLKWIHYTTIERIEKQNLTSKNDRIKKINAFLDQIRKEKVRLTKKEGNVDGQGNEGHKPAAGNVQVTKKYQNKIKIQQDIIDLQRQKLERQERMIMELKMNKLTEDVKEARQEIKNELKSFIRSGDPKTKAKAKCLQLIGNLKDAEDDNFARLQGRSLLMPQFLQNMQERALERSIKHEQARKRRLMHEAEREAQKVAAEEAKRLEDEEAKRLRIEALKEKRRLEKMEKVIKERERQRALENNRKSQEYCRLFLLRRVGMECFRRLLQLKSDNLRKCEKLRRRIIQKNCFLAWCNYYVLACERKIMRADDHYNKILRRDAWNAWKRYVTDERSKFYVAVDWCEFKATEAMFIRWYGYSKRQKMIEDTKMRQAASHHEWHLKWKVLDRWQCLPQLLQLEKETEERRQRWRMKIWELLPDYTPNRDQVL